MSLSQKLGVMAASCQTIGNMCYNRHLESIPVINLIPGINFLPQTIGSIFFTLSGFFWFSEALLEELPSGVSSRIEHIKNKFKLFRNSTTTGMVWGFMAGFTAFVGGALTLTALYAAASSLFWPISALGVISGLCWYKSAAGHKAENKVNRIAAAAQVVATVLFCAAFLAATVFAPPVGVAVGLGIAGLVASYVSPILWFSSYNVVPFLSKRFGSEGQELVITHAHEPLIHHSNRNGISELPHSRLTRDYDSSQSIKSARHSQSQMLNQRHSS